MSNIKPINVLAIETSTNACSVALSINDQLIHRYELEPRAHTRILMPMIDSVLHEAGLNVSEIQAFAYGCGPGSFTGVRIAAAVIQGLGFGVQKPVIPISSLRALAQQLAQQQAKPTHICAMFDARMQEMYWGLFKANQDGIVEAVGHEQLGSRDSIVLPEGDWIIAEGFPHATEVALLAKMEYTRGRMISAENALPVYLRNKVV